MPLKKLTLRTTSDHRGKRLDQVLTEWLPQALSRPLSKAKVRKLIVAGAVYLNGRRVRIASKELMPGARVDAYVDLDRLLSDAPSRQDRRHVLRPEDVLYEDEWLIALAKPPGLPTQPTLDEARDNLYALVQKFLVARDGKAQPYVGLHHRLDRDTSGVVLFTKAKEANAGVAEAFASHQAVKTYNALTVEPSRLPPTQWEVRDFLGKLSVGADPGRGIRHAHVPGSGKKARFGSVRSGGDPAHTEFRLIKRLRGALWVEASPRTGRTHQIRVHLSEAGMPILGDAWYGGPTRLEWLGIPRMMLHAVSLTLPHPIHKTEISIHCPLPEDFLQCLQALQQNRKGPAPGSKQDRA